MRLKDKRALITGGSTGIGLATARAFLDEGARVVISGHDPGRLEHAAAELGGRALTVLGDLRRRDHAERVTAEAIDVLGGIDVLFLNAGVTLLGPLGQVTEQVIDDQMALHVKAPVFMVQAAADRLGAGASVVLTTSCLDELGMPGMAAYSASKAAQRSLTRTLAAELVGRGVRVNAIAPGPTETPIYGKFGMEPEAVQAMAGDVLSRVPMGRFAGPDEIARGAVFLASSDSSYMTGHELTLDGGWTTL
jgi:NAD(P)-dependent dehydrogenase (short-subunit alcohol dehydrogenase family)